MDAETRKMLLEIVEFIRDMKMSSAEWLVNPDKRLAALLDALTRTRPSASAQNARSAVRFTDADIELLARIAHEAVNSFAWDSATEYVKTHARKFTTAVVTEVLKRIAPAPRKRSAKLSKAIERCVEAWREDDDDERCQISIDLHPVPEESTWYAMAIDMENHSIGEEKAPTALRAVQKLTRAAKAQR